MPTHNNQPSTYLMDENKKTIYQVESIDMAVSTPFCFL